MQPDVYCRRLGLRVPVSVSVKTGRTADVFHVICGIAMNPCVFSQDALLRGRAHYRLSYSSLPGATDRAMTVAARLKMYVTLTALLGGCTAGLLILYRTFLRSGGTFHSWRALLGLGLGGKRDL